MERKEKQEKKQRRKGRPRVGEDRRMRHEPPNRRNISKRKEKKSYIGEIWLMKRTPTAKLQQKDIRNKAK
jgi:hypothetical protein